MRESTVAYLTARICGIGSKQHVVAKSSRSPVDYRLAALFKSVRRTGLPLHLRRSSGAIQRLSNGSSTAPLKLSAISAFPNGGCSFFVGFAAVRLRFATSLAV